MGQELAASLRAWRARLEPETSGFDVGPRRRAPGLRREEVALLAGISANYLTRLEQGRAHAPSPSVVGTLAQALQLSPAEAEHLHRLAGLAAPAPASTDPGIPAAARRMLDRFPEVPAIVIDPCSTIVAHNAIAVAYLGGEVLGRNSARHHFLGASWITLEPDEAAEYERSLVGDLHRQLARRPGDPQVRSIVDELQRESARFAALWHERPVATLSCARKTAHHPTVGTVTVDCDVLELAGTELRVVVWSAPPGSADAEKLARLAKLDAAELTPAG